MSQPFIHSAENLQCFFSQPGRGFYVPYYQRPYAWDSENAKKLVTDIFYGIKRTITKPNNSLFLGTVILHNEKDVKVGVHADTPNLLTKVSNVVDGQQRITSIAMLACVMSQCVSEMVTLLLKLEPPPIDIVKLIDDLKNQKLHLEEFYSVEIKNSAANPRIKPLIIRAGEIGSNPSSDQWTLAGKVINFYRSNTSAFLSDFITSDSAIMSTNDERIQSVIDVFKEQIKDQLKEADLAVATGLLNSTGTSGGSLYNFIAYPPDIQNLQMLEHDSQKVVCAGILLLAACYFLKNCCHLVVIECADLDLAFDMFQSLNATGTPLTAFEVFKPHLVKEWGSNYASIVKPEVDRIEKVFETESTAALKEDLTDRVLVSTARIYNGKEISAKFSEERDWLVDSLPKATPTLAPTVVIYIADQAEYCQNFIEPRKPSRNSVDFALVTHLMDLGIKNQQADEASLCVYYLREAGHVFAHNVLSLFYSNLLRAQGTPALVNHAADEFLSASKALAAFFTLWMGAGKGGFPDATYKKLFQQNAPNITVTTGSANQTAAYVKEAFRNALIQRVIYDELNPNNAKLLWVNEAKNFAWYTKKAVCKFALFVASHDAATDLNAGKEGLFTNGMKNSANMLNCRAWHGSNYEVIEHVAPRDKPTPIKFQTHFDDSVYPGNKSVVDRIGNLSLLSREINSSISSEWPEKVFYYWSLTTPSSTTAGPNGAALQKALGLTSLPPSLSSLVASSNYVPHLAPLAYRGTLGLKWDSSFIEQRSEHICERVFDTLDRWLR